MAPFQSWSSPHRWAPNIGCRTREKYSKICANIPANNISILPWLCVWLRPYWRGPVTASRGSPLSQVDAAHACSIPPASPRGQWIDQSILVKRQPLHGVNGLTKAFDSRTNEKVEHRLWSSWMDRPTKGHAHTSGVHWRVTGRGKGNWACAERRSFQEDGSCQPPNRFREARMCACGYNVGYNDDVYVVQWQPMLSSWEASCPQFLSHDTSFSLVEWESRDHTIIKEKQFSSL